MMAQAMTQDPMAGMPTGFDMAQFVDARLDFNYSDVPALHPEIVVARSKQVYETALTGRSLIGYENAGSDAIAYIKEGSISGGVDWLSEEGGFPKIDFDFSKASEVIKPYGHYFDITFMERKYSRIHSVGRKISRSVRLLRKFEDELIYNKILAASGIGTVDGTAWDDVDSGTPVKDIEAARQVIINATDGDKPNTIVMSSATYEDLTSFDIIRNKLYYGNGNYVKTGELGTLAGLEIMIENRIDPDDEGQALVCRKGELGFWASMLDLQTPNVAGLMLSNPLLDRRYFCYAAGTPIIDAPEMGCIISGLVT